MRAPWPASLRPSASTAPSCTCRSATPRQSPHHHRTSQEETRHVRASGHLHTQVQVVGPVGVWSVASEKSLSRSIGYTSRGGTRQEQKTGRPTTTAPCPPHAITLADRPRLDPPPTSPTRGHLRRPNESDASDRTSRPPPPPLPPPSPPSLWLRTTVAMNTPRRAPPKRKTTHQSKKRGEGSRFPSARPPAAAVSRTSTTDTMESELIATASWLLLPPPRGGASIEAATPPPRRRCRPARRPPPASHPLTN